MRKMVGHACPYAAQPHAMLHHAVQCLCNAGVEVAWAQARMHHALLCGAVRYYARVCLLRCAALVELYVRGPSVGNDELLALSCPEPE